MGIHVHLAMVVERVSEATWQRIYAKACRVAARWTPAPLSLARRDIGIVRVAHYTPDIENPDGLHIVGDTKTLTTGESFVFPVTLGRRRHNHSESVEPEHDALVAVARRNASATQQLPYCDLFGAKTQGLPYHTLIVALGLLVEHLLPGTAVVHGDMSREDGEQARDNLTAILEEEVALPVVLEEERMRRRLAVAMDGDADAHQRAMLSEPREHRAGDRGCGVLAGEASRLHRGQRRPDGQASVTTPSQGPTS